MIEDEAAYTVHLKDNGDLEIQQKDGPSIAEDPDNQVYCSFLTWMSHRDTDDIKKYNINSKSNYYCEMSSLIEGLKRLATVIHVRRDSPDASWQVEQGGSFKVRGRYEFSNIYKASAISAGTYADGSSVGLGERTGFIGRPSPIWVRPALIEELNRRLPDDKDEVRKLSTWPIERSFVYFDISDYSELLPGYQVLIVNSLVRIVNDPNLWSHIAARESKADLEARIFTGDGCIFAFTDPLKASFFAAYLAYLIEWLIAKKRLPVEFHFRMGVHVGPVFSLWDPGRNGWNYVGAGIIGGQRILSVIGKDQDDVLFMSSEHRQRVTAQREIPDYLPDVHGLAYNRGRRADKHGNYWRVYEVNHTEIMSRYRHLINDYIENVWEV
ncbi:MAG TPA: hypothetical protein VGZ22_31250 [Isosphaeraceae bacterium]|jgi:hypothetical protein|nr:hypothetical protein [Isosphaeraceae bacterium]